MCSGVGQLPSWRHNHRVLLRFNIKFAIVLFAGLTHFEYHAGGYGIRALDVGIIKTFDVGGHFLHVELVLYFFQDAYFLFARDSACPLVSGGLLYIVLHS